MKPVGSVVLLVLSLVFAGCATRQAPAPSSTAPRASSVLASATTPSPAVEPKEQKEPLETLAGTNWRVLELDGAPVAEPVEGWEPLSLEFDPNGLRVTGNGGVNRFGGRYDEKGRTLYFGPLAMTRRLGPPAQMEAEELYTRMLSRVVAWRQEGSRLVLIGGGERRVVLLERVAPPARKR